LDLSSADVRETTLRQEANAETLTALSGFAGSRSLPGRR
jgi:hypothetical protein